MRVVFSRDMGGKTVDRITHLNMLVGPYSRRHRHSWLSRFTFALWALFAIFVGSTLGFLLGVLRNISLGHVAAWVLAGALLAGPAFAQHHPSTPAERAQTEQLNRNAAMKARPPSPAMAVAREQTYAQIERVETFAPETSGLAAPVIPIGLPRQLTLPPGYAAARVRLRN